MSRNAHAAPDAGALLDEPAQGGSAAPAAAAPFIWCSDCRAPQRTHYYALNDERPLCGRCKPTYVAKIARGTGAKSTGRAALYGLGAALAGAALVAAVVLTIRFGRAFCAIAIAYMIAKAVNAATGDYFRRRYQVLAVALTYFAVGLGSLAPVAMAYANLDDTPRSAAAAPATQASARAASDAAPTEDPFGDLDAPGAEQEAARARVAPGADDQAAERLVSAGPLAMVAGVVVLLLTLPLLTLFAFGIHGAVVSVFALVFAMRKAWQLTGSGVTFGITGPHRVGTGPIPTTR